jgi:hypothetical protein
VGRLLIPEQRKGVSASDTHAGFKVDARGAKRSDIATCRTAAIVRGVRAPG